MNTPLTAVISKPWFERLVTSTLVLTYAAFLFNHIRAILDEASLTLAIFVIMESLVVILLLMRQPPRRRSDTVPAWFVAFFGTFLPLFFEPTLTPLNATAGSTLMIVGGIVATLSYLSLNTSFGISPAQRTIKVSGLYRLVRHPMYLSYVIIYCGYLLISFGWLNVMLLVCIVVCLIARIFFEEAFLKKEPTYTKYASRVRYRLIPLFF